MTEETTSLAPETEASEEVITTNEAVEGTADSVGTDAPEGQGADGESQDKPDDGGTDEATTRNKRKREARKERQRQEREELQRLQAQRAALEAAKSEEPREANFDDYEDYRAAKAVWMYSSAQTERESAQITAKESQIAQQRKAQVAAEFAEQVADAKGRYQDFEQVAFTAPISDELAQMVAESEVGADLAYFLGSNTEIAQQVSSLPPIQAARELGRIEASLTAPKPKTTTKVRAPIDPISGGIGSGRDPENMSMTEYRRWREGGGI